MEFSLSVYILTDVRLIHFISDPDFGSGFMRFHMNLQSSIPTSLETPAAHMRFVRHLCSEETDNVKNETAILRK